MRFTTMRLCGGEALMAISADDLKLDMGRAVTRLEEMGCTIKQKDDMMAVMDWRGMETTIYPQGKVMFFPLKDRSLCIKYATEMLEKLIEQ
ncbi:MAG: hypothetical protein LBH88_00455 [Candidatus Methanoplasma sp.]|jgi:hypothetical protein|nr:hypothetical protein [Candidatus Methanoplasma sp.]